MYWEQGCRSRKLLAIVAEALKNWQTVEQENAPKRIQLNNTLSEDQEINTEQEYATKEIKLSGTGLILDFNVPTENLPKLRLR